VHHLGSDPDVRHRIDDRLGGVQVGIPRRAQGLAPVREQGPDPVDVQIEHDGLERWIHARTIAPYVSRPRYRSATSEGFDRNEA
jgi:hypothetical protein